MAGQSRRRFMGRTAALGAAYGVGAFGPFAADAASGARPAALSPDHARTYAAWCDVLAPGAAAAGVAAFLDAQLAKPYAETLLFARHLLSPPFVDFYLSGIAAIDAESRARFAEPFLALDGAGRAAVVKAAAEGSTTAWTDPPPGLFYLVTRADAVDVVYGTVKGFDGLGIAYLPHITPPRPW